MKRSFLKIFGVVLASMLIFCSCEHVQKIADAVVSSAGAELSSALSDAQNEISDGMNELGDALGEVTSVLTDVSEDISSVGGIVSDHIESALSEAEEDVLSELGTSREETTTAIQAEPDETTIEAAIKQYKFRDKKKYEDHYKKHGAEFGNITKEEYLQMANDLINSTSDRVLHKTSKDGDYLYFDQDTGYFLVLSDDGYIRTFFIPTAGKKYYDKQ